MSALLIKSRNEHPEEVNEYVGNSVNRQELVNRHEDRFSARRSVKSK
jgi:hypothetical protein